MRVLSVLSVAAIAAFVSTPGPARAEIVYPYCAYSSGGWGDNFDNCGFVSMEQCYQTVRGAGGWCQVNPRWVGPQTPNVVTGKAGRASPLRQGS